MNNPECNSIKRYLRERKGTKRNTLCQQLSISFVCLTYPELEPN